MAPRKNRAAGALDNVAMPLEVVETVADIALPIDVARKPRSRKGTEVPDVLHPEAEKENVVNVVPAAKRGGKTVKVSAATVTLLPVAAADPDSPEAEEEKELKPTKRDTKKKPLQESNAVTDKEVDAMTKDLQDIQLGKARLKEKEAQLQAKEAQLNQEAAALQQQREEQMKKHEEQKKKDEKLRKLQKVEKDEGKLKRKIKDPELPKKNTTAFLAFSAYRRPSLVTESEPKLAFADIAKRLGEEWKKLTDEEKTPYEKIANEDKLRYVAEKESYLKKKAQEAQEAPVDSEEESEEIEPAQASKKSPKGGELSMKRKVKIQMKDPNKPKKAPSGYDIFKKEMQQQVKEQHPEASFGERSRVLAKLWQEVDEAGKREYNMKAQPAQDKYKEQMSRYRIQT